MIKWVVYCGFRKGLKYYLKKYKYKNAEGENLWDTIGKISKMPVTSMVNSWIKQIGFPLVDATFSNSTITLQQKRFLLESNKPQKGKWIIPVSIGLTKEFSKKLLTKNIDKVKLPMKNNNFIVNFGRNGFYRVKYDEGILLDLKYLVSQKEIPHIDRWAIQNDMFALCLAGEESVKNYLDFSDAYYDEESYLASVNVANNLNSLYHRTFDEDFSDQIKDYTINYFRQIFNQLGWDGQKNEKHTDVLLRSFAIGTLGRLDDEQIIEEAQNRFKKFLQKPVSLPADLRDPVYSIVAWNGDKKTHKKLIQLFTAAKTQEEKLRFLGALCSFKDEKLLGKSLDFSQTSAVRSQNMQLPIMKVAANPYGKKILWPWLKKNWTKLSKKVGYGNPLFNRIVASISLIADDSMEKEIRQFFKKNPTPGTERTLEQTLERIRINSKFLKTMRREFNY
jgi:tricorn protease interacting factor F2/3